MKITVLKQFNAVGIRILVNDLNSIDEYLSLFGIESYFEDTDFLDVYHVTWSLTVKGYPA